MTLFECPSQFREKATIYRIFQQLPLYAPLAEGHVFRWWALNIPMDLGTGGSFTSDIDILASLRQYPKSALWRPYPTVPPGANFYKSWEVKVSLLCEDGSARSLKTGKTLATMKQLKAYRDFGSPDVSLLDVYICESGFMKRNVFPPKPVRETVNAKIEALRERGFGYQILPFEHGKDSGGDIGLLTCDIPTPYDFSSTHFRLLSVTRTEPTDGFSRLMGRLDQCYERDRDSLPNEKGLGSSVIVFCRRCRDLSLTRTKEASHCPRCREDLRLQ